MKTEPKRWGQEITYHVGEYMLKRIHLDGQTSMHFHYAKTETLYVLEGTVIVTFHDGRPAAVLNPGDTLTIQAGKKNAHRMQSYDGEVVYLEASTPHPDDSERLYE